MTTDTEDACGARRDRRAPQALAVQSSREIAATGLGGTGHLTGLKARGARVHALRRSVHNCPHTLNVRVPTALGAHVGVRDAVPEAGALAADVAVGSHDNS